MFVLFPRLEHPAGWICARYKSLLLLLLLVPVPYTELTSCMNERLCPLILIVGIRTPYLELSTSIKSIDMYMYMYLRVHAYATCTCHTLYMYVII